MAYNRETSKLVLALKALAWLCDNWGWPLAALILLTPMSPHLLIGEGAETCTYAGRLVTATTTKTKDSCPIITFFSVY